MKRKLTNSNRQKFLEVYSKIGNLTLAAKAAKVNRNTHYLWLADPEYRHAFEQAHEEAVDLLVEEARRRAHEGWDEPIVYQGSFCYPSPKKGGKPSNKPLSIRKFDSTLLMFLIKGARPEIYRDTWKGEIKHSGAISAGPDLSNLTDAQLEQLNLMLQLANGSSSPTEGVVVRGTGGTGEEEA